MAKTKTTRCCAVKDCNCAGAILDGLVAAIQGILVCGHMELPNGCKAYLISDARMQAVREAIGRAVEHHG